MHQGNGGSFIYRENNSRYIGVQFSIEGRDLARAVNQAQDAVRKSVVLPVGYTLDWGGEFSEYVEAREQFAVIGPLAILLIFMILFALYGNFKFPVTLLIGVVMTEPVGALIALKLTHTPFSVSSALGLLALMGVSVGTAAMLVSYRSEEHTSELQSPDHLVCRLLLEKKKLNSNRMQLSALSP